MITTNTTYTLKCDTCPHTVELSDKDKHSECLPPEWGGIGIRETQPGGGLGKVHRSRTPMRELHCCPACFKTVLGNIELLRFNKG